MSYAPPAGQTAVGYAPWITRVGGYIVDALPGIVLVSIGAGIDGGIGAAYSVCALIAFAFTIWNRWILAGRTGQSIGRKAVGIRLVSLETGQPIGAGAAFARDIVHIIDALPCMIGFLAPLWDQQNQTWADKIMKTVVIK